MYRRSLGISPGAMNAQSWYRILGMLRMMPPMMATCMYRKSCPNGLRFCRRMGCCPGERWLLRSTTGLRRIEFMMKSMKIQQMIMPRIIPMSALMMRQRSSSRCSRNDISLPGSTGSSTPGYVADVLSMIKHLDNSSSL